MSETIECIVSAEESGERLDKLLVRRFPEQSRTYFQQLIDQNLVTLNGKPVKKRVKPAQGDTILVTFALTTEISLTPEAIPLSILYEDSHLIAVNKPAGMVVHPAPGHWSGTFVNALLYHCKNLDYSAGEQERSLRPGIVHRLDKETSGVLIAAKTREAHQKLIQQFAQREMQKEYVAICFGKPTCMEVDAPIGRHPKERKKMAIITGGRSAETRFEVLGYDHQMSIVKAFPKTGRTHQIRVHLKHLNTPVVGDTLYASPSREVSRHLLHAYTLSFSHPITGSPLKFTAPIPQEIQHFINQIDPNIKL